MATLKYYEQQLRKIGIYQRIKIEAKDVPEAKKLLVKLQNLEQQVSQVEQSLKADIDLIQAKYSGKTRQRIVTPYKDFHQGVLKWLNSITSAITQLQAFIAKNENFFATSEVSMSQQGQIRRTYTTRGEPKYSVDISHLGLNKYQVITDSDQHFVIVKAQTKMAQWDNGWARKQDAEQKAVARQNAAKTLEQKQKIAAERSEEAQRSLALLSQTLASSLNRVSRIEWEFLKKASEYPVNRPTQPSEPTPPDFKFPLPPQNEHPDYQPHLNILDQLISSWRAKKVKEAQLRYNSAIKTWQNQKAIATEIFEKQKKEHELQVQRIKSDYQNALDKWHKDRTEFLERQARESVQIDRMKASYERWQREGVIYYCDLVLSNSQYPDYFPQSWQLEYTSESGVLIVDYQLPPLDSIPTLEEVNGQIS